MHCEAVKTVVQVSKIVWLELERKVGLDVMLALSGQLTHQALSVTKQLPLLATVTHPLHPVTISMQPSSNRHLCVSQIREREGDLNVIYTLCSF